MIPKTYQEWRHCITVDCGIPLSTGFIAERLAVLENTSHQETRRFIACYGLAHLTHIIQWLKQASSELSAA